MFRLPRCLGRLVVGVCTLVLTGVDRAAFAAVSPPDPVLRPPPAPVPLAAPPTGWQELHWMLSGAAIVVVVVGAVLVAVLAARRHGMRARRAELRRGLGLG